MRIILAILFFALSGCFQRDIKHHEAEDWKGYWVSKNLEHYSIDSAFGSGHTIYGSGYLLKLDSNKRAISLGADFYWENDSLYQGGEPGMTLKIGKWRQKDQLLLLSQALVFKTIVLSSDQIGQSENDSLRLERDSSMIYRQDTLIFVKKLSSELERFLDRIVSYHRDKNGNQ